MESGTSQKWESKDRDLVQRETCLGKQSPGKSLWNGFASRFSTRTEWKERKKGERWKRGDGGREWQKEVNFNFKSVVLLAKLSLSHSRLEAWGYLNNSQACLPQIVGLGSNGNSRVASSCQLFVWSLNKTRWEGIHQMMMMMPYFLSHSRSIFSLISFHLPPCFSHLKCNLRWLFSFNEKRRGLTMRRKNPTCKCWVLISYDHH